MRVQAKPPKRVESKGVKMSPHTITEPDMALTTLEILRFHTRQDGSSIKPTHFDKDGIMTYYNRLSKVEKEAFAQENAKNLTELKGKAISEYKAEQAKQSEAQKAVNEQKAKQNVQQNSEGTEQNSKENKHV